MSRHLRVLMVEDDQNDAELLVRKLRSGGFSLTTERVDQLEDVRAALHDREWDLVLSDHSMPGFRSADVITLLKTNDLPTPLIIVSGAIGEQEVVEALHLGAASYVDKSSLSRLIPTVQRVLDEATLRREHQVAQRRLELVQTAVESAHDLIFVLESQPDAAPTVVYANRAAERITGYPAEELIARGFAGLYGPETDPVVVAHLREAMARGEEITAELLIYQKDGTTRWVETGIRPIGAGSNRFVSVSRDVTDRKEVEVQMAFLAMHDPLTGLANRALLDERLKMELAKARRSGLLVAAMLVDFDNFKSVNDTFGHAGGDELLRVVAKRLRDCVREVDTVARIGGDEFVVILTAITSKEQVAETAGRILASIREPIAVEGQPWEISVSVGIALYSPEALDSKALLKAADAALYRVKDSGKNGFRFATE